MSTGRTSLLTVGRECYLRSMNRVLLVEILGIFRDTIWVSFPSRDSIGEGTGVELEFHDDGGYIVYHARVAYGPRHTTHGVMLKRTESADHMAHRRDWRVPMDLDVWVKEAQGDQRYRAHMKDLSSDGAQLHTEAPFEAGECFTLIFQLPEYPVHQIMAQVVYADKTQEGPLNRFGVRFLEVSRRARESVTWFLYQRIRDLYPAELQKLYPRGKRPKPGKQSKKQPA